MLKNISSKSRCLDAVRLWCWSRPATQESESPAVNTSQNPAVTATLCGSTGLWRATSCWAKSEPCWGTCLKVSSPCNGYPAHTSVCCIKWLLWSNALCILSIVMAVLHVQDTCVCVLYIVPLCIRIYTHHMSECSLTMNGGQLLFSTLLYYSKTTLLNMFIYCHM